MIIGFLPVLLFIVFLTSPKPSKSFKVKMTLVFLVLAWLMIYIMFNKFDQSYRSISLGALYLFSGLLTASVLKVSTNPEERVNFICPFCEEDISFDKFNLDKSKHCPECHEVVTVTEDEEVHKAAKQSYDEIMAAMESEDLQESPENLKDPSIAPSVLGFQFELKKDTNSKIDEEDKEKPLT